ncbi:MAG: T9SS type A sorting domain-containing protein [Ignavibacteria bacterium]|nr:T9SS type A sorting domain-containing protein [Ignavibacteria bacterium]
MNDFHSNRPFSGYSWSGTSKRRTAFHDGQHSVPDDPTLRPGFHACLGKWGSIPTGFDHCRPSGLFLYQNFPNPFNPLTTLGFSIPAAGQVTLRVFDILGALVATPVNELLVGGTYHATFDASQLPSGTYVYTLQFGEQMLTKRMTVMK